MNDARVPSREGARASALPLRLRLAALLAALVTLTTGAAGCSLITSWEECASSADCATRYQDATQCVDGVCALPERTVRKGGPCAEEVGDSGAGDAQVFGVMVSTSSAVAAGVTTEELLQGLELARREIDSAGRAPLAFVACVVEEGQDITSAAEHLRDVARVRAVVTALDPAQTAASFDLFQPADILQLAATGYSAALEQRDTSGLLWSIGPRDEALGEVMGRVAVDLRTRLTARTGVAVFRKGGDARGEQLAASFLGSAGGQGAEEIVYTDAADASAQLGMKSGIGLLVLLGDGPDAWAIVQAEEQLKRLPAAQFLLGPLAHDQDATKQATGATLHERVTGVRPQWKISGGYFPYVTFSTRYRSAFNKSPDGLPLVATLYDSAYLLALSTARGARTGAALAQGMERLFAANAAEVTPSEEGSAQAYETLARGDQINFNGASGQLDFDDQGAARAVPLALWCRAEDGALSTQAQSLVNPGGDFTLRSCAP